VDLSSIGTLFAFVLVCGGILVLENSRKPPARPKFKTPYINGRYLVPLLYLAVIFVLCRYFKRETWDTFFSLKQSIPMLLFILVATVVAVLSFVKKLSLIPVLGLLTCLYLMTQLGVTNWMRFGIWLVLGLAIYFLYSRKSSKLNGVAK
jgi:hypothetical protein